MVDKLTSVVVIIINNDRVQVIVTRAGRFKERMVVKDVNSSKRIEFYSLKRIEF